MMQLGFLVLTLGGAAYTVNAIFDDTYDPRTILHGRLGLLAFSVGVVGLLVLALK